MKSLIASLLGCTLIMVSAASAQVLRLEQPVSGAGVLALGGDGIEPCNLPLPGALEGAGRDLLLRLDTAPRTDCIAGDMRDALRIDINDLVDGGIDGDGLHRVFLVDAAHPERSLGMSFIDLGEGVAWTPESGQWWPERNVDDDAIGPGTGLFVEIQNGALSLFFATYDDNGHADWLMAAGRLDGRIFRGDLLRFSGGQPPFGAYRAPGAATRVAAIELAFHSPSRAELWLMDGQDDGVRMQVLPLTRFLFGHSADARAWLGEWSVEDGATGLPDRLRFDRAFSALDGYLLVDASGRYELACRDDAQVQDTLPQRCTLYLLESGLPVAELDNNALNALGGQDSGGNAVRLLRRH
ncbi:MAG TPA: hypothetical protein PKZ76_14020 [Xanthomonadaceae bacterium]|nr:hypothetical protein [Xanthomonadaceae bacterium]